MALPLHIFEERYLSMVNECLDQNRQFGVILAEPKVGTEVPTGQHTIGTSALITHVDRLEDGHMDIVTAGLERFRILDWTRREPYAVARIEPFPLEGTQTQELVDLVKAASAYFVRYLRLAGDVLGTVIRIESAPRDASTLAYMMAIALQISNDEKQTLLSTPSLPTLLWREAVILSREEVLLGQMKQVQEANTGYVRGISDYLSLN
jgi:Lon protease-like protein